MEANLVLPGERSGIVVPAAAVVDDGGTAVVYAQLAGESFARREVRVRGRQGRFVLVEGLGAGERVVERGGEAIRRSTLLSAGEPEGHVH
jgi:multidrug efflux pump subunit AcrA (membrane-fusion protein)